MAELPKLIRTLPLVEQRIHAALAERRFNDTSRSGHLHMSQIGKCERFLWAELNGEKPDPPRERILVLFDHGHAVERHVLDLLDEAGYGVISEGDDFGGQIRVSGFDGRLVGHLDGKISMMGEHDWSLLEIKSANTKQFELLKEVGYEAWKPDYAAQIQMYMGYAQLPDAVVVVYSKENSEIYAERIRFDLSQFSELRRKAERILDAESLPDRPAEAKSQYCKYCKYCDLGNWCWGPLAGVSFDD